MGPLEGARVLFSFALVARNVLFHFLERERNNRFCHHHAALGLARSGDFAKLFLGVNRNSEKAGQAGPGEGGGSLASGPTAARLLA